MPDCPSERSEILAQIRVQLADLAEQAATLDKLFADDPTPQERHELESARIMLEEIERGLTGIVKRLGE